MRPLHMPRLMIITIGFLAPYRLDAEDIKPEFDVPATEDGRQVYAVDLHAHPFFSNEEFRQ